MPPIRHIALIGVQLHGNDAALLRGIFRFARERPQWLLHDATGPSAWAPARADRPCGVIANVVSADVARRCRELRVPVVNVSGPLPALHDFPSTHVDDDAVGRMAADYLLGRGFRHFAAFNHMADFPFIGRRAHAFAEHVRAARGTCSVFDQPVALTAHAPGLSAQASGQPVALWLAGLPQPCGVFATTDHGGRELCWICRQRGIPVPDRMAILGVDDFDLICATSHPPLSSVRQPSEMQGYEAAAMLDAMLAGRPVATTRVLPPLGIATRQSTDTVAVSDRAVALAIGFIRAHAQERCRVDAVARAAGINRRALERRFRAVVGHSVLQAIQQTMVAHARRLLIDTDWSVAEIATAAGFGSVLHLERVFGQRTGENPTAFRRRNRAPHVL